MNHRTGLSVLERYTKSSPEYCGDCYFMIKPTERDYSPTPGYCSLDTTFDLHTNWRFCVSDDHGCTPITFLKKLLEVL